MTTTTSFDVVCEMYGSAVDSQLFPAPSCNVARLPLAKSLLVEVNPVPPTSDGMPGFLITAAPVLVHTPVAPPQPQPHSPHLAAILSGTGRLVKAGVHPRLLLDEEMIESQLLDELLDEELLDEELLDEELLDDELLEDELLEDGLLEELELLLDEELLGEELLEEELLGEGLLDDEPSPEELLEDKLGDAEEDEFSDDDPLDRLELEEEGVTDDEELLEEDMVTFLG